MTFLARVGSILLLGIMLVLMMLTAGHAEPLQPFGGVQAYVATQLAATQEDEFFETADFGPETTLGAQIRLPRPLTLSRSFSDGAWRIDGVGVRATPDVEIRATGRINAITERMQADLTLRFQF